MKMLDHALRQILLHVQCVTVSLVVLGYPAQRRQARMYTIFPVATERVKQKLPNQITTKIIVKKFAALSNRLIVWDFAMVLVVLATRVLVA
jgi:hypothetical protein